MMRDAILNFAKQFEYEPVIENAENFVPRDKFIVCGMGGSGHSADIIHTLRPELDILIHRDYGLPKISEKEIQDRLIIISSYSGNTEEPLEAFEEAFRKKLALAAVSVGGKLLDLAKSRDVPFIQLPNIGIQPRSASGFSLMALLRLMSQNQLMTQAGSMARTLKPQDLEKSGKELAEKLKGYVPVIYASSRNYSIANNWKIKMNENSKIPAFCNVFPELNHNEMNGFSAEGGPASGGDVSEIKKLSEKFHFIFLKDSEDHPKIVERMKITAELYRQRDLPVEVIELQGSNSLEKIFNSLLLADWTSFYIGEIYGSEVEQVPMVEEFKKLIA